MENQTDNQARYTAEEISTLIVGLGQVFESPECTSLHLDDDTDRGRLAGIVAHWILSDKTILLSPEKALPKATYKLGFNIVDEASGEHIVRLTLDRERNMTDGDFMQLQNFFWVTVGRAIRDNPEARRTLELGGVRVVTDPAVQGGQQHAG